MKDRLPSHPNDLYYGSDASDTIILHLWQSIQLVIDIALSFCVFLKLGTPKSYAEAFIKLADKGVIDKELAIRLVHAAGFRWIVHAYEKLDIQKVYLIAKQGPQDLLTFLSAISKFIERRD